IGLQIVGAIGADALVLRASRAFEEARPFGALEEPREGRGQSFARCLMSRLSGPAGPVSVRGTYVSSLASHAPMVRCKKGGRPRQTRTAAGPIPGSRAPVMTLHVEMQWVAPRCSPAICGEPCDHILLSAGITSRVNRPTVRSTSAGVKSPKANWATK